MRADRQTKAKPTHTVFVTFGCGLSIKKSNTKFLQLIFCAAYYFSGRSHSREKRLLALVVSFRLSDCISAAPPGQISEKIQILPKPGKNIGHFT
jgi:hypothetical protein